MKRIATELTLSMTEVQSHLDHFPYDSFVSGIFNIKKHLWQMKRFTTIYRNATNNIPHKIVQSKLKPPTPIQRASVSGSKQIIPHFRDAFTTMGLKNLNLKLNSINDKIMQINFKENNMYDKAIFVLYYLECTYNFSFYIV